jgi:small subunit ribosomal protein S1
MQEEHPTTEGPVPDRTLAERAQHPEMGDVFADEYAYQRPKRGEIRQGRIIAIRDDSIIVDLGLKREGVVPADDLQRVGSDVVDLLKVGDEIPVYVLRPEDDKEGILVSIHRARQEQDWIDAERLHDTGEIWEGKIAGYNRGGLIVHYGKIRGFIPASHLTGVSRRMDPTTLQARLTEMVGQDMPLKVIEVDRQNRRLIFSERTARREWRSQQREKLLDELKEGDHVRGMVSNVCDFGVFVDVGGTDGLVHISELSWRRTGHPSELLKVGDEVEAYVLRVDKERKRIGLSLRLMEPDPWERAEEKYQIGQVVYGTITKIIAFGAFAALDDGIEGLIHISELGEVAPKHPEEVVSVGLALPLAVVKIDSKRRRMGLSFRHVPEEERSKWEAQREAEAVLEAETTSGAEVVPEAEAMPETQATPGAEVVPEAEAMPETQATPATEAVPEAEAMPETQATPGAEAVPEAEAMPETQATPATEAVPEAEAMPETQATLPAEATSEAETKAQGQPAAEESPTE